MSEEKNDSQWHLDKRIPLALIFAILVQTATGFWWASGIDSQVSRNTAQIDRMHTIEQTLARIDERLKGVVAVLNRQSSLSGRGMN